MARASQTAQALDDPSVEGETDADARDRRTRLLDAGEMIFAERGYEDVSAQDIAARAGVAHGLLFHYFGNKRRFYFAVLERRAEISLESFSVNTTADPARWLRKEVDIFLTGIAADNTTFASLVHGSLGAQTEAQDIVDRLRRAAADRVIAKLAPERSSPLLVGAVTAWVASANELGVQWIEGGCRTPRTHLRQILIGTLEATLRGVAAIDRTARFDPARFSGA